MDYINRSLRKKTHSKNLDSETLRYGTVRPLFVLRYIYILFEIFFLRYIFILFLRYFFWDIFFEIYLYPFWDIYVTSFRDIFFEIYFYVFWDMFFEICFYVFWDICIGCMFRTLTSNAYKCIRNHNIVIQDNVYIFGLHRADINRVLYSLTTTLILMHLHYTKQYNL